MRVIAVTGMPGSGKGEVADVARSLGIKVYSMGDVVRSYFTTNFPDRDPIETGLFADMERQKHGKSIWARRLVQTVERELEPNDEIVVIDGLRSRSESILFREHWGADFRVLAVHSSPRTRYRRLSKRGRSDDTADRKKFDQRDERELGWGLGDVISLADEVVVNERGIEELRREVKEIFSGERASR